MLWREHFLFEGDFPDKTQQLLAKLCLEVARKFAQSPEKIQLEDMYVKDEFVLSDEEYARIRKQIEREYIREGKAPQVILTEQQRINQQNLRDVLAFNRKKLKNKGKRNGNGP